MTREGDSLIHPEGLAPHKALGLILLTAVMLTAGALWLPHDPYIRYQQFSSGDLGRLRWVHERIHFDATPIDVAIVGSSRIEAAVSAPALERALGQELGRQVHVANLAVPMDGRDLHYVLVAALLQRHPETRMVLMSLGEPVRRTHPAFKDVAEVAQVLRSPIWINYYWLENAAGLPYRNLELFVQTLWPSAFGVRRVFEPGTYAGTDFDTTRSFRLDSGRFVNREAFPDVEAMDQEARERLPAEASRSKLSRITGSSDNIVEETYTEIAASKLRARCGSLVLLALPVYRGTWSDVDVAGNQLWAPVLLPPASIGSVAADFSDAGHLRRAGIDKVTAWLPGALRPYLDVLRPTGTTCIRPVLDSGGGCDPRGSSLPPGTRATCPASP